LLNKDSILIKFNGLLYHRERSMFKTESEIRDEKIDLIISRDYIDEYCHYSDLPSPMAYIKKENNE